MALAESSWTRYLITLPGYIDIVPLIAIGVSIKAWTVAPEPEAGTC